MQNNVSINNEKTLVISLIGAPNTGKSTLVNLIVGEKVSGVSPKPHTTINYVRGVITKENKQIVFVDTPGFMHNKGQTILDTDAVCLMIDATRPWQYNIDKRIPKLKEDFEDDFYIVINKCDCVPNETVLEIMGKLKELGYEKIVWLMSALRNKGVEGFIEELMKNTYDYPWLFEDKRKHDQSKEEIILECIREKIFLKTYKEIPYVAELEGDGISFEGKKWEAKVKIKVDKDGQKNILIGKNAQTVKAIGEAARLELCQRFGPGSLFLQIVKNIKR